MKVNLQRLSTVELRRLLRLQKKKLRALRSELGRRELKISRVRALT